MPSTASSLVNNLLLVIDGTAVEIFFYMLLSFSPVSLLLQLITVEQATHQAEVFASLKLSKDAISELQKRVKLEDVQKLMEDTEDAREYQKVRGETFYYHF